MKWRKLLLAGAAPLSWAAPAYAAFTAKVRTARQAAPGEPRKESWR